MAIDDVNEQANYNVKTNGKSNVAAGMRGAGHTCGVNFYPARLVERGSLGEAAIPLLPARS